MIQCFKLFFSMCEDFFDKLYVHTYLKKKFFKMLIIISDVSKARLG